MTSVAHLNQPRDSGKFSFKTAPEAPAVRLGDLDTAAAPARNQPLLDRMMATYASTPPDASGRKSRNNAATLGLLRDAAAETSTDKEAARYLFRRWGDAIDSYNKARHRKVGALDIRGRIRRRQEIKEAGFNIDAAHWTSGLVQHAVNTGGGRA